MTLSTETKFIWIGLRRVDERFVYEDGIEATSINTKWHTGQPDDHEMCCDIYKFINISNFRCTENLPCLCEL